MRASNTASIIPAACAAIVLLAAGTALSAESAAQAATGVFARERWSPYAVGALLGVLSWAAMLLSGHSLGASSAYVQAAGMLERAVRGPAALERPYYRKLRPEVDWGFMLLAGVVLGAFLSSALSGALHAEFVPDLWRERFGPGAAGRFAAAFAGGTVMGIGARWAGGCTSGHGISGNLQLMTASVLASASFFIGGIVTAFWLY